MNLGIYMRSVDKQQQFYTDRGKWRIAFSKDIDYVVKGFTSMDSLTPLLPHFPDSAAQISQHMQSAIEGGVPRPVGAHLLERMMKFVDDMILFYRKHSHNLDNLHAKVADSSSKREFTLAELAIKGVGIPEEELNDISLFAVHWASCRKKFLIEHDRSSVFADHYVVQPLSMATTIDTVITWVHEHQEHDVNKAEGKSPKNFAGHPLQRFLTKARRLIQDSRDRRPSTLMGIVGPSTEEVKKGEGDGGAMYREITGLEFDEDDRTIIRFLVHYSIPPRQMVSSWLRSAGSHIMRATDMYGSMEANASTMPLFLQEIGIISPWENLRLLDQSLALPGHGVSKEADGAWLRVERQCKEFKPSDSMKNMRTDWGDLPVYCVDSPGAQEIDDAVSLERIPGSDDTFWVRVHVANPSAFLRSNNPIAEYAALRNQSLYVPERTYPMLPKSFTNHFSLARDSPTLTFSAKMNLKGEVLDTNITNGIVRNVIYASHDMLRELFGAIPEDTTDRLKVGGDITWEEPVKRLDETLSDNDKETFRILRQLLVGFRKTRLQNGAIEYPMANNSSVLIDAGRALEPYVKRADCSRHFVGDPTIHLPMQPIDPHEVPDQSKRYLISITMNLACYVAGKWCAERNIPAVYDGTWYHPEYPPLTNENLKEAGGDGWRKFAPPKATSSAEPLHHVALGLPAYVKTTSPLRRYIDLLAHFQIEAALRYEREHSTHFDYTKNTDVLPFTKQAIEAYIDRSKWRVNALKDVDRSSRQFWACLLLFRAFYFEECKLPETFRVLLQKPYSFTPMLGTEFQDGYMGVMSDLGVKCQVAVPKHLEGEVDVLSLVDAKITEVNMARMIVSVETTGLVKRFERVGEWA